MWDLPETWRVRTYSINIWWVIFRDTTQQRTTGLYRASLCIVFGSSSCSHELSVLSTMWLSLLEPGLNPWLTCLEDGLWSLPEVYCKLECEAPPVIPNAHLLLPRCLEGNHDVSTICKYECKPGYYVKESSGSQGKKWVFMYSVPWFPCLVLWSCSPMANCRSCLSGIPIAYCVCVSV